MFVSMIPLECDVQGFRGHEVQCPIQTTVVPGFSGDLIGFTANEGYSGIFYCPLEIFFAQNKPFEVHKAFSD